MKTIYELQQEAIRLRQVKEVDSISPEETFGLHADTLAYLADMEQNAEGLGIHKVYKSFAAMNEDSSAPVGTNGKPLRFGQLVAVYDKDNQSQAENGNIYAFQKGAEAGWLLMGNLNSIGEITSKIAAINSDIAGLKDKDQEHDEALSKKANAADVDSKFAEESERVDAELAKKANAKDVEQSFSKQIDKNAEQDAEIAKKANAEEVDSSLKELQNTVFPLQVSLLLEKTLLEFTGTDQTVKASYSIKRKDVDITPTSLALSVNGTMLEIGIKDSDTISIEVNKEGESTLVLTAKHGDLVKSATAKVVMALPIYFGFGASEADVAIAGNKLGPRTSAAGVYEKTSAKDNVNFIILVPKTLPRLTSFTMGGAPCVMDESSVAINGKNYYMYKTAAVYMTGATLKVQAG